MSTQGSHDQQCAGHEHSSDARQSAHVLTAALATLVSSSEYRKVVRDGKTREPIRRFLGGLPAQALPKRLGTVDRRTKFAIADAIVTRGIRPRLGRGWSGRKAARRGESLTLMEALDTAHELREGLGTESLRLLLASDWHYAEYLFPWAGALLASTELGLWPEQCSSPVEDNLLSPLAAALDEVLRDPHHLAAALTAPALLGQADDDRLEPSDPGLDAAVVDGSATLLLAEATDRAREAIGAAAARLDDDTMPLADLDTFSEPARGALADLQDLAGGLVAAMRRLLPEHDSPQTMGGLTTALQAAPAAVSTPEQDPEAARMLGRLAGVTATIDAPAVSAAAEAFAAAADEALTGDIDTDHPLLAVVEVLDTPNSDVDFPQLWDEVMPRLARQLPTELAAHLGMLSAGMLELPPADDAAATSDTPPTVDVPPALTAESADPIDVSPPSNTTGALSSPPVLDPAPVADPDDATATRAQPEPDAEPSTVDAPEADEADDVVEPVSDPSPPARAASPALRSPAEPAPAPKALTIAATPPAHDRAAATGSADEVAEEAARDALVATVAAGRWSASYWVAHAIDQPQLRDVLGLVAYATEMRRLDGPLTGAFNDAAAKLDPQMEKLLDGPVYRTLLLGAAGRAALVSPYVGAVVLSRVAPAFSSCAATTQLLETMLPAAQAGLRFGSDGPASVRRRDQDTVDDPLGDLADTARQLLADAPKQKMLFHPATEVWRTWMVPSTGTLGKLLQIAADGDVHRRDHVSAQLNALTRNQLESSIDSTDRALRGHRGRNNPIESTARMQLLHRGGQVRDLLAEWVDTAATLTDTHDMSWESQRLDALRAAIDQHRHQIRAEVAAGLDLPLQQAALKAVDAFDQMLSHAFSGTTLRGIEPTPERALHMALLKVPDMPLDAETLGPEDAVTRRHVPDLARSRSWEEAFQQRTQRGYYDESTAILDVISSDGSPTSQALYDRLAKAREQVLAEAHAQAAVTWKAAEVTLQNAQVHGILDVRAASELDRRLQAAHVYPGRVDVGRARRTIDRVVHEIDRARDAAVAVARETLSADADENDNVAEHVELVRERIEAGDLAVAHDLLLRLRAGELPTVRSTPELLFDDTFTRALPRLSDLRIDQTLIEAVRDRTDHGPLDFSQLTETLAERAASAAQLWGQMSRDRAAVTPANLKVVLGALGLGVRDADNNIEALSGGSTQHVWRRVSVHPDPIAPVPQFGTDTRGRFQLLLTQDGTSPGRLVNLAVTQGARRPVVALHFGVLTGKQRQELGSLTRPDSNNAQVVVIDTALFAHRLTHPDDLWATTLGLALPFSSVNPYVPDAPELPPEMFFGRRDELGQIMDLRGSCVLYGGRKLGKSALLREAARQFRSAGADAVAVYLDVKNHNIGFGTTSSADRLWPVLHAALAEHGLPLDETPTDPDEAYTAIRQTLLAWLDDHPGREVLVLLDECDRLLDADAEADRLNPFPVVRGLYQLAQDSERRFKPVFAGLHKVQRFQRLPNQPFAHLGRAITIGGLDAKAAHDLIVQPLSALGCTFDTQRVIARILAYTNYHPALLQVFGSELIRHVFREKDAGAPPYEITLDDVERVMGDERTRRAIRDKFIDTISLDARYRLIAYTLAYHDIEQGYGTRVTPAELRQLCDRWRSPDNQVLPEGDRASEVFRRLLDEMVDLGVLAPPVTGRYAMRSPLVTQLLAGGDEERLYEELERFSATVEPILNPANDRRSFVSDSRRAYPLTEQQLDGLSQPRDQVQLLLTTPALGGGDVTDALTEAFTSAGNARPDLHFKSFDQLTRRTTPKLPKPKSRGHRLLVTDLRGLTAEKIRHAFDNSRELLENPHPGTAGVVLTLGVDQLGVWRDALSGRTIEGWDVPLTVLQRWDGDAVDLWVRRADVTRLTNADRNRVTAATGGWPQLLQQAAALLGEYGGSLVAAAEHVHESVATDREVAGAFVAAVGLDQLTEAEVASWQLTVEMTSDGEPVPVEELAELVADETGRPTFARREQVVTHLHLLELVGAADQRDGNVCAEPVVASAWTLTRAGDKETA